MKHLTAALLLLLAGPAWSACTGSSPTWTASSNSATEVAACITAASSGDTINVPAGSGSVTWSSGLTFPTTKSINLIGPGAASLTVTVGASVDMHCNAGFPHRVSGFTFNGGATEPVIFINGACSNFRFDHNVVNTSAREWMTISAIGELIGPLYGLVDNNTINAAGNTRVNMNAYPIDYGTRGNWSNESHLGTANNIYFEDNTFDFGTQDDAGTGVTDSNSGSAWVFRFNTVYNGGNKSHGVCNAEGTANQSVYNNTYYGDSGITTGYRFIHQQGSGEAIYFGNRFNATGSKSTEVIDILHYRSAVAAVAGCSLYPRCDGSAGNSGWDENRSPTATYKGYRCRYQPGSRAGPSGTTLYSPQYAWDNAWADTGAKVGISLYSWGANGDTADHVHFDRDVYEAVSNQAQSSSSSPFNGTTGVGWGTLANRPTTCTTSSEGGAGVGYWATDQGEWNSRHSGADGQLYVCTATNTWTLYYRPYTYPHPLQTVRPNPVGGVIVTQLIGEH